MGAVSPGEAGEEPKVGGRTPQWSAGWPAKQASLDPLENTSQGKKNQSGAQAEPFEKERKLFTTSTNVFNMRKFI